MADSDVAMGFIDQDIAPLPSYNELCSHTLHMMKESADKDAEINDLRAKVSTLELELSYLSFVHDTSNIAPSPAFQFAKPGFMVSVLSYCLDSTKTQYDDIITFCRSRRVGHQHPMPRMHPHCKPRSALTWRQQCAASTMGTSAM